MKHRWEMALGADCSAMLVVDGKPNYRRLKRLERYLQLAMDGLLSDVDPEPAAGLPQEPGDDPRVGTTTWGMRDDPRTSRGSSGASMEPIAPGCIVEWLASIGNRRGRVRSEGHTGAAVVFPDDPAKVHRIPKSELRRVQPQVSDYQPGERVLCKNNLGQQVTGTVLAPGPNDGQNDVRVHIDGEPPEVWWRFNPIGLQVIP